MSSSLARKIKRDIDKKSQKLLKELTRPDEKCDECTKPHQDDCFMTCPELCARNKQKSKVKSLIDEIRNITGDQKIQ